ncbi:hypothetical protein PCAR4_290135 [Paraburkholderia caribensis]|nr:hypothetical protein PCAR4_290135 [Paraburkholderia caribensis]
MREGSDRGKARVGQGVSDAGANTKQA